MFLRATTPLVMIACLAAACGGRTVVVSPRRPIPPSSLAELRVDPGVEPRDLFWGVGGQPHAPPADATYALEAKDETGFSVSFASPS